MLIEDQDSRGIPVGIYYLIRSDGRYTKGAQNCSNIWHMKDRRVLMGMIVEKYYCKTSS